MILFFKKISFLYQRYNGDFFFLLRGYGKEMYVYYFFLVCLKQFKIKQNKININNKEGYQLVRVFFLIYYWLVFLCQNYEF